ncbi:MAG: DsrE/DsrF/DrsH-like family protein [Nannocystaceae bacterium]
MDVAASPRKVAIIVSKGGMDEVFPALILANGARQSGIEACLFFTFYGLDAIIEKKVDHLHVNMAGNPSAPIPTMVAGLPGMESLAAAMMKRKMADLQIPTVREMLQMLHESGARIFACELAMKMFTIEREELLEQVEDVITVGDFYDVSDGAQILFT